MGAIHPVDSPDFSKEPAYAVVVIPHRVYRKRCLDLFECFPQQNRHSKVSVVPKMTLRTAANAR